MFAWETTGRAGGVRPGPEVFFVIRDCATSGRSERCPNRLCASEFNSRSPLIRRFTTRSRAGPPIRNEGRPSILRSPVSNPAPRARRDRQISQVRCNPTQGRVRPGSLVADDPVASGRNFPRSSRGNRVPCRLQDNQCAFNVCRSFSSGRAPGHSADAGPNCGPVLQSAADPAERSPETGEPGVGIATAMRRQRRCLNQAG